MGIMGIEIRKEAIAGKEDRNCRYHIFEDGCEVAFADVKAYPDGDAVIVDDFENIPSAGGYGVALLNHLSAEYGEGKVKRWLDRIPFDRPCYTANGNRTLMHATGFGIWAGGQWWDEFEHSDGYLTC